MLTANSSSAHRIAFETLMEPVARRLLGEPNAHLSKPPKDLRFGTHGSMSIDCQAGQFFDHEAKVGGGVLDLVSHKLGCDRAVASTWLRREGLLPEQAEQKPTFVCAYDYCNENGVLLYQVIRYSPKTFKQRRPGDKHGEWIWKLGDVRRVLYRLSDIVSAVAAGRSVHIVEGEKDADNLAKLGLAATTCAGGAEKWSPEYNESLRGADVVIIPDNDQPGHRHVKQVAASLSGTAKRVRILDIAKHWPECPSGGDISVWIEAGGTADQLSALIAEQEEWNAPKLRLQPLTLSKFFSLAIKPREMLLAPIIPEKGLAMLYASRGTGKTFIALGIAYAVATGTGFLRWKAAEGAARPVDRRRDACRRFAGAASQYRGRNNGS